FFACRPRGLRVGVLVLFFFCAAGGGAGAGGGPGALSLAGAGAGFPAPPRVSVLSQPPGGVLTSTAASGCCSGVQASAAWLAGLSDCGSRRAPQSSRLFAQSEPPSRPGSAKPADASVGFGAAPLPRTVKAEV